MLGWFKKKFKKQEPVAPAEEVVVDDLDTDTRPPEQEHTEDAVAPETAKPLPLPEKEEQGASEPTPSEVPDQVTEEEPVPEPEKDPWWYRKKRLCLIQL